jgi:hypothetical protein
VTTDRAPATLRGLTQLRPEQVIGASHAFAHNLGRGHYELATDVDSRYRSPDCLRRGRTRFLSWV